VNTPLWWPWVARSVHLRTVADLAAVREELEAERQVSRALAVLAEEDADDVDGLRRLVKIRRREDQGILDTLFGPEP
jgi:hypothetical protein